MPEGVSGARGEWGRPAGISRLLKKSASGVLASLRGSAYRLGKRLFTQAMGSPVKRSMPGLFAKRKFLAV